MELVTENGSGVRGRAPAGAPTPRTTTRAQSTQVIRSFEVCRRIHARKDHLSPLLIDLLPAPKRPYAHVLAAFTLWADHLADEGEPSERARAVARLRVDTLAALEAGPHTRARTQPVLRALAHMAHTWNLRVEPLEEFFTTLERDSLHTPYFGDFTDLRSYLRGMAGTIAELCAPVLEPTQENLPGLLSLLGETIQLVDILHDLHEDLARGRCYLPRQDLEHLGLQTTDLTGAWTGPAHRDLLLLQVERARELLAQGKEAVEAVHPSSRPFLSCLVSGLAMAVNDCEHLGTGPTPAPTAPARMTQLQGRSATKLATEITRHQGATTFPPPKFDPTSPPEVVPAHVAVIMDGNRRWARHRGLSAVKGHLAGEEALHRLVEAAGDLGIGHVTVFAFSTENWSRPPEEISSLLNVFAWAVPRNADTLHRQGMRLRWCGRRDRVGTALREQLERAEKLTADNPGLTLTVCLDYGGRQEMADALGRAMTETASGRSRIEDLTQADVLDFLYEPDLPEVDLLIRTSGEQRISNFLPWHTAYAEIFFDKVFWPDYDRSHLLRAVHEYAQRHRSFGGTLHKEGAGC